MRASKWIVLLLLAVPFSNGCKGHHKRRYAVYPEPAPCATPVEGGVPIAEGPTMLKPLSFVDRHPLFSKPRDYYEDTDYNPIVKTAAAVIVGVPAGIVGEVKQIVNGPKNSAQYSTPATTVQ